MLVIFSEYGSFEPRTLDAIDYVAKNYKINSCLINCVIDNFKDSFDKKNKKGYRNFKNELTYEYLLKLLDNSLRLRKAERKSLTNYQQK